MILKKVTKDNQTTYVEISPSEAEEARKNGETVIEVADEKKEEEHERNHEHGPHINMGSNAMRFAEHMKERIERDIGPEMRKFGHRFSFHQESDDEADDSINSRLLRILPFMEDEDVHEIVQKVLASDPEFAKLKLPAIMPFLNDEDCDAVFKKALTTKELERYIVAVVPFVSQKALAVLVDQYLEGAYPDLNIDGLYPFLDSKDIRRIFNYLMKK